MTRRKPITLIAKPAPNDLSYVAKPPEPEDTPTPRTLLIRKLKEYMVTSDNQMPNDLFVWSASRNSILGHLMVAASNGEFDDVLREERK